MKYLSDGSPVALGSRGTYEVWDQRGMLIFDLVLEVYRDLSSYFQFLIISVVVEGLDIPSLLLFNFRVSA